MSEAEHCPFLTRCPMFAQFTSHSTLRIFQLHYCKGDHNACERKKRAQRGVMPPGNLLPDGTLLRPGRE